MTHPESPSELTSPTPLDEFLAVPVDAPMPFLRRDAAENFNLLRSTVISSEGDVAALNWNGITITANPGGLAPRQGEHLYVVLRPEAIHCSAAEPVLGNRIKGKIRQRVFKGNHTSLMVEVAGGAMLNTLVHPSDVAQLSSEDIWLGWKPETTTVIPDRHAQN